MNLRFVLVLVTLQASISYSVIEFCDYESRNKLIDSMIVFNDTIYAFRRPNVFILTKIESGYWSQAGGPYQTIPLQILFKDFPETTFGSGFAVTNFVKCDSKESDEDLCRNFESPDFDASNVTFLFLRRKFYIYRRINSTHFKPIDAKEKNTVPWKANELPESEISELFDNKTQRIDGVLYVVEKDDPLSPYVLILTDNKMSQFYLTDTNSNVRGKDRLMEKALFNGTGNGALIDNNGDYVFIFDNKLFRYVVDNPKESSFRFEDMNTTTWDYFDCSSRDPQFNASVTPDYDYETQTVTTRFTVRSTVSSSTPKYEPPRPNPSVSTSPPKDSPSGQRLKKEDQKYVDSLWTYIMIIFALVVITMICSTFLVYLCCSVLS